MASYRNRRKKPMSDINVVPYIDVMLVLLIIFMVTTPLLTEGVKVELPKTNTSEAVTADEGAPDPFVLTVDVEGQYYIDENKEPKSANEIEIYAARLLEAKPTTKFLVRGDKNVIYDKVMQAMVLLKSAGIEQVSLVTESAQ